MRLNCSKDTDFDEAVQHYAKAFAISGYKYDKALNILKQSKSLDRIAILKNEQIRHHSAKRVSKHRKLFWVSNYDPRVIHQRRAV